MSHPKSTEHTPDTEWAEAEEIVMQEIHNYGAWLLNNPNAEPLVRRAKKSQMAKHVVKTICTSHDTYWKERVRKEVEGVKRKFANNYEAEIMRAAYLLAKNDILQALDNLK